MSQPFPGKVKLKRENTNMKTFNIYCDESCHLEHDHKLYMFLGSVSCAYPQVKVHSRQIRELMVRHNFYREIKWSTVSRSKLQFYLDLVDYFFATDLCFRSVGVEKAKIVCDELNTYDDFYYKMYYQLVNFEICSMYSYNVYLDIKDTLSAYKVKKLKDILNNKYNGNLFHVQNIRSEESVLMQLSDFIMGAISYNVNDSQKLNAAKVQIIERIKKRSNVIDLGRTNYNPKLNLFFIKLK